MKKSYEALYILNTKGLQQSAEQIVEKVLKEIEQEGGEVSSTKDLGLKDFAYNARKLANGHYYNVFFAIDTDKLTALKKKLDLVEELYTQQYLAQ